MDDQISEASKEVDSFLTESNSSASDFKTEKTTLESKKPANKSVDVVCSFAEKDIEKENFNIETSRTMKVPTMLEAK
jgi:hypothetical protein